MERHVLWTPWEEPGLEHLHFTYNNENIIGNSVILGVDMQEPFRVQYEIRCDSNWELRNVRLNTMSHSPLTVHLSTDGKGTWMNEKGETIPTLSGCLYVDISATPFTNTLPIRRLALNPGMSTTLNMVYIAVPQLQVSVVEQRYTCLELTPDGSRYRYESLNNGVCWFSAELPIDSDGLVLDYPGLFRRVGTW
jgi:hypothetical protein